MSTQKESLELVRSVIQRIAVGPDRGRDISAEEAYSTMRAILNGEVNDVQTAVILIALRMKRESLDEFSGLFRAMQETISGHTVAVDNLFCLADPFDGFLRHESMTPFLPAVLAACGLPSLMTGVESVGPKHGVTASKIYQLAGIAVDRRCEEVSLNIGEFGWGYLDQSIYAPKVFALNDLRETIVKRTAVTTLERLLMPLRAKGHTHAVLGYVHRAYPEIYAHIAQQAGFASCVLIKGVEGGLAPALNKPLRQTVQHFTGSSETVVSSQDLPNTITAETAASLAKTPGQASPEVTLDRGLRVLRGEQGTARNSLILAAAHILCAHQVTDSLAAAVEKVQNCLDNGSALTSFNALR